MPQETSLHRLVQEGRLTALSPPLPAADTERLQHLARSLNGPDAVEHGEQLKQLILESLARNSGHEETAALKQQLRSGTQANEASAPADLLWQERLLLLLADQAEREEEELAAAFSRISKKHQALFANLVKGTDTEDGLEDPVMQVPVTPLPEKSPWQPKRMKAWSRLLSRTALPRQDYWYITRQESLAAQIREQHQSCSGRQAIHVPELLVPSHDPEAENIGIPENQLQRFSGLTEAFALVQNITSNPTDASQREAMLQEAENLFGAHIPVWNAHMLGTQATASGCSRLRLSLLPGLSLQHLLSHIKACEPAQAKSAACSSSTSTALCLFGLLLEG